MSTATKQKRRKKEEEEKKTTCNPPVTLKPLFCFYYKGIFHSPGNAILFVLCVGFFLILRLSWMKKKRRNK
jgi:hypothetical protein